MFYDLFAWILCSHFVMPFYVALDPFWYFVVVDAAVDAAVDAVDDGAFGTF